MGRFSTRYGASRLATRQSRQLEQGGRSAAASKTLLWNNWLFGGEYRYADYGNI
jgi:hypothetical protein